jgi:hypothetical protein
MPLAKVRVLAFVRVLHVFISKSPHATFARTMPVRPREARFLALSLATVAIIAVVFVVVFVVVFAVVFVVVFAVVFI